MAVAAPDDPLTLPAGPGTYVLLLRLFSPFRIPVGRLGTFEVPAGFYLYVGSARGPGGPAARVARHLRHPKPLRWHVDFLRAYAQPVGVWWAEGVERRECVWARALARLPGASLPIPGFGASDCRCPAHLVHFAAVPDRETFAHTVGESIQEVRFGT